MPRLLLAILMLVGFWPKFSGLAQEVVKGASPANPVEEFRRWLSLDAAQRDVALQGRTDRQRVVLKAKLEEYQNLPAEDREARLKVVELQFYLRPLMQASPSNRNAMLAAVPTAYKKTVETRLQEWDLLPGEVQKEVLDSQTALHYFIRFDSKQPGQQEIVLKTFTPDTRKQLEQKVQQWEAMPSSRRQKISRHVEQFLDLPELEKQRTLKSFSDEEREEMEKTLQSFERLSPAQRKMCVESFGKFAEMSANDRKQFLRNAERWQAMSAQERETWRNLVSALPPLPPDVKLPPMPVSAPELPGK